MRSAKFWVLVIFLTLPAFGLMLRPGIFSMHDPHLFRIQQFDVCAKAGIFPCRWSPDSSKGFGSPLFNFYAQGPYWLTQTARSAGLSLLDSAKAAYIFSLIASAVAMYVFARRYWGNVGGVVSAIFYVFAPYRAVDVWVRGAIPESLAFVLYPLILLSLDKYLETRRSLPLLFFSLLLSLLLLTHNLSFLMFSPFLFLYWLYRTWTQKSWTAIPGLIAAGIMSITLSAFYLLPVIIENRLVTLTDTVSDYYNFQIHFTRLHELFISRFWGYGASLWAQKYLSVSAGHLHWLVPIFLAALAVLKRRTFKYAGIFWCAAALGFFALFLTHGKSLIIWKLIEPMKYIQFPWRFLSPAAFFLSFAVGSVSHLTNSFKISALLIAAVIAVNVGFFRPDVWQNITDQDLVSGRLWDEGRSSSLTDFWPNYGPPPNDFAPDGALFIVGDGRTISYTKTPNSSEYKISVETPMARVVLPQVYFPGWTLQSKGVSLPIDFDHFGGLISVPLSAGTHELLLKFTDTPARRIGNYLSTVTAVILFSGLAYLLLSRKYEK